MEISILIEVSTLKTKKENLLNKVKFLECEHENVSINNKSFTLKIE